MSTIAAISTAPGIGGIGIVRISGKDCFKVIDKIFKPKSDIKMEDIKGYTIKYGHIVQDKEVIDEVLVSFFRAPNSYTTEDLCEISSHGGVYIVRKILEICLQNGAELAEPGEFTKRAFFNGRIDLSQAEAVIDVINSRTEKEAKSSLNQLDGYLSKKIARIREMLMSIMVDIEVCIDYPEYDIDEVSNKKALSVLEEVKTELDRLRNGFDNGKIIKEGINVALIGRPNAGKSSLLNAILKEERAIVTDIEGTTRDVINESVVVEGIPVNIIDTAGIRDATNEVEKLGIEKSKKLANEADLVIAIFDLGRELNREDKQILEILESKKSIIVLNKIDLKDTKISKDTIKKYNSNANIIEISAKEYIGIEEIYKEISRLFNLSQINLDNNIIVTNIRHKNIINKSIEDTENAIENVKKNLPIDIIAIYIKDIMEELGKITGECVSDDIIKEIFAKFCLGK